MLPEATLTETAGARCVVDYALARRAVLTSLAGGRIRREDACDAQVYLTRAAKFHGEPTEEPCPVCRAERLIHVTYTYGESLGAGGSGRARTTREVATMAGELREFSVYVVEVCLACRWNHLVTSCVLGRPESAPRRARSRG